MYLLWGMTKTKFITLYIDVIIIMMHKIENITKIKRQLLKMAAFQ